MPSSVESRIKQLAREAGFDLCGIAPAGDFRDLEYFPEWIATERHGEMRYMESRTEAGDLKRAALKRVAPWARSVVVCAINYNTAHPYSNQLEDADRGWISRYAWSQEDYHEAVMRRLRHVEAGIQWSVASGQWPERSGQSSMASGKPPESGGWSAQAVSEGTDHWPLPTDHCLQTRCYVDTGPLVERVYAKCAGIGWIGKNTCIINQKLGSWLFLGVILTSLELTADLPAPDRCGTCTRCLDACPTHAFIAPGQLDARLCVSYLTIEKRGEVPENLRAGVGRHVFGCDICQDVCPWNRKAPVTSAAEFQPREGLVNPALEWLAEMQQEEFRNTFRKSPVRRSKLSGLRRNAVIAMGNSRNQEFLPTLKRLSEDHDPVVAEHARWALQQLQSKDGAGINNTGLRQ